MILEEKYDLIVVGGGHAGERYAATPWVQKHY